MGFLLALDYCCLTKTCQRSLMSSDEKNSESCKKIADFKECDIKNGVADKDSEVKKEQKKFCRNCSVSIHTGENDIHHYLKQTLTNINAKMNPTRKVSLVKNSQGALNVEGVKYTSTSDSEDEATHK